MQRGLRSRMISSSPLHFGQQKSILQRALSSNRDNELAANFAVRVEGQADPTAAQHALEQQVGDAINIRRQVWRSVQLVRATLRVSGHTSILAHSQNVAAPRHTSTIEIVRSAMGNEPQAILDN